MILRNTAGQPILIGPIELIADGAAVTSGASITTRIGGVSASGLGTLAHVSGGVWEYIPTQAETDTPVLGLILSASSARSVGLAIPTTRFPTQTTGVLPAAAAGAVGGLPLGDASGRVLLQPVQSGVTIPTVTSVTNRVNANIEQIAGQSAFATTSVSFPSSVGTSTYAGGPVASVIGNIGGDLLGDVVGTVNLPPTAPVGWIGSSTFAAGATLPVVTSVTNGVNVTQWRGNTPGNLDASGFVPANMASMNGSTTRVNTLSGWMDAGRVVANTDKLSGQSVIAAGSVTFPSSVGTSVYAGGPVDSVTGNVGGNVIGSVGSVVSGVTLAANQDIRNVTGTIPAVTLATTQPNYAPSKAGDAMALIANQDIRNVTGTIPSVTLAASQPTYAPSKAGDAMALVANQDVRNVTGTIPSVTLASSQPNYAPSKAGDAMALVANQDVRNVLGSVSGSVSSVVFPVEIATASATAIIDLSGKASASYVWTASVRSLTEFTSKVSIANGGISEASFTVPADAAGPATGILAMIKLLYYRALGERDRNRTTGVVRIKSPAGAVLVQYNQDLVGDVETVSRAV